MQEQRGREYWIADSSRKKYKIQNKNTKYKIQKYHNIVAVPQCCPKLVHHMSNVHTTKLITVHINSFGNWKHSHSTLYNTFKQRGKIQQNINQVLYII